MSEAHSESGYKGWMSQLMLNSKSRFNREKNHRGERQFDSKAAFSKFSMLVNCHRDTEKKHVSTKMSNY